MMRQRTDTAWFIRLLRHPDMQEQRTGSIWSIPEPTRGHNKRSSTRQRYHRETATIRISDSRHCRHTSTRRPNALRRKSNYRNERTGPAAQQSE